MATYTKDVGKMCYLVSDFYIVAYTADSEMFGFSDWCEENDIKYWTHEYDDRGKVFIYFEEDTDCMAAKLRWA